MGSNESMPCRYPPRRRTAVVGAVLVCLGALGSACGQSTTTGSSTSAPTIAIGRLLDVGDLPAGWAAEPVRSSAPPPCSDPPTTASIVGVDGSGVRFADGSTGATLVEYAVRSPAANRVYASAVRRLQFPSGCASTVAGHTRSSTFEEVIPLPHEGAESIAMLLADDVAGSLSQSGYVIVRQSNDVLVVGYHGPGNLDSATLQGFVAQAFRKFTAASGA